MFDTRKTQATERIVDAIDLAIDFATLGEYGLEPAGAVARPCETRCRTGAMRSSGTWSAAIARFAPQGS